MGQSPTTSHDDGVPWGFLLGWAGGTAVTTLIWYWFMRLSEHSPARFGGRL